MAPVLGVLISIMCLVIDDATFGKNEEMDK